MAGSFVTLVNPGYSALFTRDLSAVSNANVSGASVNLFDPDSSNPLQEGEWLQINDDYKFTRGVDATGALSAAGGASVLTLINSADNVAATRPCFMHFAERGRYDAQVTRKAHCIVGPAGFEFRTKQIVCASGDEGERCFVYISEDSSGRLLSSLVSESAADGASTAPAPTTGSWFAGVILRVHGTNDATVLFQPGFHE